MIKTAMSLLLLGSLFLMSGCAMFDTDYSGSYDRPQSYDYGGHSHGHSH